MCVTWKPPSALWGFVFLKTQSWRFLLGAILIQGPRPLWVLCLHITPILRIFRLG